MRKMAGFIIVFLLASAWFIFWGAAFVSAKEIPPPEIYVQEDAHPYEGCVYRKWNVLAPATLYKKPNTESDVVAKVRPGDLVQALTGTLYSKPARVVVTKFHQEKGYTGQTTTTLYPGDVVYLVASLGEGFFRIWHNGNLEEISVFGLKSSDKVGAYSGGETWGVLVDPYDATWWVKVTTKDGVTGWTNQGSHFGNKDLYGGRSVSVVLNYQYVDFKDGKSPYLADGAAMLELSTIAPLLKCTYSVKDDVAILLSASGAKAEIVIGTTVAFINGRPVKLSAPSAVKYGNIYIPAGLLRKYLNAAVEWDAETCQVKIDVTN